MELTTVLVLEGRLLTRTALTGLREASLSRPIRPEPSSEAQGPLSIAIGRTCLRLCAVHGVIRKIDF